MKKSLVLIFGIPTIFFACQSTRPQSFDTIVRSSIDSNVVSIVKILTKIESETNTDTLKKTLITARKKYKILEPFVEYYYQGLVRRINGPLPEVKTDDNMINEATGFQVIEEIIYSDSVNLSELKKQAKILSTDLIFVKEAIQDMPIQDHHFYEMMQHQIIRIATLGITGFDSPVALQSIQETHYSLQGIREWYYTYCQAKNKTPNPKILTKIEQTIEFTKKNNDFNTFNRLFFIKNNLMPLSKIWEEDFETVLTSIPDFSKNKVFYGHLENLMQGKKLNPDAFSPFSESATTPQKVFLGKLLFNNSSLSKNNNISCATCHHSNKAFTDGKIKSVTNIHNNTVKRNSPTVFYAGFQKSYFYDMRSQDLENQIENVMKNPDEFDLSPKKIQQKILVNTGLAKQFKKAYPNKKEITPYEIRNAIAAYIRSLMPFNAKIDEYFNNQTTLSPSEMNGFNLFTGKAKCATCHFIPLYNGTIPPWFNNTESEVIGVPKSVNWKNAVIDTDVGRFKLNQLEPLKYSFKTPTIRNSEKTAPYMHNGVYKTLEEIIKFYELGGGNGIGMSLSNQTLPFDNLRLTTQEKQDIIAFLKTLTDKHENN